MTTTKQAPRWTRVMNGWYSLNIITGTTYNSLEIVERGGFWNVTVNDVKLGMVETLAVAKRVALAAI